MKSSFAGLVLIGGKSKRMGRDKGKLVYRGISQRLYEYALLESVCEQAYFSCNEDQQKELEGFPCIVDQWQGQGPLGGILSAFEAYPHTSFLVLACDLPNISRENLQSLVDAREPAKFATVMQHPDTGRTEPLIGIWEATCYAPLKAYWNQGGRKVMDFLSIVETVKVLAEDPSMLQNVNTYEEYLAVK